MTKRARKRPKEFRKPDHWDEAPVPNAEPGKGARDDPEDVSPTRYGDWTKNGIAIDF